MQKRIARRMAVKLLRPSLYIHRFVVCEGADAVEGQGSADDYRGGNPQRTTDVHASGLLQSEMYESRFMKDDMRDYSQV
ncbi:hypothetical protein BPAE_0003g01550 [Botrytis paeoniae]|uniref:Uncharacterized protein n=1 Tax=Botrytis paeoniae TaxID=278948 RepID=A0A4Z1G756_9HELO|nr:hypothetical protein BPAE_0003g01550 [Botrytis paeoniae]